ncbi:MAG TPA: hypothetical protein EYP56_00435 [Planctomycetaceae bacterium]|nr:hypothetical protein [Planctomycetaceae bacterium]
MGTVRSLSLSVVAFVAAAVVVQAGEQQAAKSDPRVKALLEELEVKYTVDKDGDYRVINSFENGRSQLVFVNSNTSKLATMEIREVWSVGYLSEGTVSPAVARNLLLENGRVKIGGWQLSRFSGKEAGVFRAQIKADCDARTLLLTLHAVSQTADEKEKELVGGDDL